eukprot:3973662-Amphidinium_carterae.1
MAARSCFSHSLLLQQQQSVHGPAIQIAPHVLQTIVLLLAARSSNDRDARPSAHPQKHWTRCRPFKRSLCEAAHHVVQ